MIVSIERVRIRTFRENDANVRYGDDHVLGADREAVDMGTRVHTHKQHPCKLFGRPT